MPSATTLLCLAAVLGADADPLPDFAAARFGSARLRHAGPVTALAVSPDGTRIATGSSAGDRCVRIWDARTGREILAVQRYDEPITALGFSPDGSRLAVGTGGGYLWLIDPETGSSSVLYPLGNAGRAITGLCYHPDGQGVVTWGSGPMLRHRFTDRGGEKVGDPAERSFDFRATAAAFSPDGKALAVAGGDGSVQIRSPDGEDVVRNFRAHEWRIDALAFHPDGGSLASVSSDGVVALWDCRTGEKLRSCEGTDGPLTAVAFAPDGARLAAGGSDGSVSVFDPRTGRLQRRMAAHQGTVYRLAFAPDGRALVSTGADHAARIWDTNSGRERWPVGGHVGGVVRVGISPDGRRVFTAGADGTLRTWDAATGEEVARADPEATAAAFAPGHGLIAAGRDDGLVRLLDADGGTVREFEPHDGPVRHLDISPDGRRIVTTGRDRTVRVRDVRTGENLFDLPPAARGGPVKASFCAGGRWIVTTDGRSAGVWDARTGEAERQFGGGRRGGTVLAAAVSPDRWTLAVAGSDLRISLHDLATGWELERFPPVPGRAEVLAFSHDGKTLFVGYSEHVIRAWDVNTREIRRELNGHRGPVVSLVLADDGRTLISGSSDGTAVLWDLAGKPIPPRLGERDAAWRALRGADAEAAYDALWALAAAPEASVELVRDRLPPATPADPERIARLIDELSSERFPVREQATAELARLGVAAGGPLRAALAGGGPPEFRLRAAALLRRLEVPTADVLLPPRVVELLERMATPAARDLLRDYAEGHPDARLTREARAALDRISPAEESHRR